MPDIVQARVQLGLQAEERFALLGKCYVAKRMKRSNGPAIEERCVPSRYGFHLYKMVGRIIWKMERTLPPGA